MPETTHDGSTPQNQYILILRDDPAVFDLSPDEMQAVIQRYVDWRNRLEADGRLVASDKLADGEGRVVAQNGSGLTVKDGPFVEAKEAVAGYFQVRAASYDDAVDLCRDCPHLDYGSIEVRAIETH